MARHDVRSMETPYQFSDWLVLSSENLCSQQSKLAVYGHSSVSRQVTTQPQRRCFVNQSRPWSHPSFSTRGNRLTSTKTE